MMAPALNSLSTGALDGIVELKRKKTVTILQVNAMMNYLFFK